MKLNLSNFIFYVIVLVFAKSSQELSNICPLYVFTVYA